MEDLHWADPSTIEFVGLVLKREAPGPLLIVLVHRPEFKAPWEHPRIKELSLGRLPADESKKMLALITRNRALPAEVAQHVIERPHGVPLFVEEIAKAVIESGALREGDREFELVASSTALTIPSTIHDSLTARLDRLGTTKALAQIAATLGRTFNFEILRAVSGIAEEALRSDLDRLVEAGLLFRRSNEANETYIFKHALIQGAAYESLLRSARQRYHQQIARALTEQFPDVASGQPEYLAQHYAGAGLLSEAIVQWSLAGQRAIARSAFAEAIDVFSKALEQLLRLPASDERDRQRSSFGPVSAWPSFPPAAFRRGKSTTTMGERENCVKHSATCPYESSSACGPFKSSGGTARRPRVSRLSCGALSRHRPTSRSG